MSDLDAARYAHHSRWSDPGRHAAGLAALPVDPAVLTEIVGGVILHPLHAAAKGSAEPELRRVVDIIDAVLAKDGRPLSQTRETGRRVLGTCRNYALLACAILRQHGLPARLRVGFADYFTPGFAEDHWVCEYHDGNAWHLLDAELTAEVRQHLGLSFSPGDVPRRRFLTAGVAWKQLRCGEHDPARFGVSFIGLSGAWFVAGSLLRDLAALNMDEMMPWDHWGPARDFRPGTEIPAPWLSRLDRLAEALIQLDTAEQVAAAVLAEHGWAALEPSVLSFPQGKPVETVIGV
jgi:hypothetical protein